ncbi:3886_t:CDS:2, partial [Racocetra persica]
LQCKLGLLNVLGLWNVNDYIEDFEINEAVFFCRNRCNHYECVWFKNIFKMESFNNSVFGTDSQLVERVKYRQQTNHLKGKVRSTVKCMISENDAVI